MSENKIKKAVIREDLLSITKDYRKAILLNQFIYWSERVSDADKFIEKENEIAKNNGEVERELFYGWIYKTAEELADEVMLGLSASQIRRYVNDLVNAGYLSKRNNPKYKWDRTLQYRVNLVKIAKDLKRNGYPLSDYKINISDDENMNTHGCAINGALVKNQSQVNEDAIPEITNNNYYNKNYPSKTTYNSSAIAEEPYNAFPSGEEKEQREEKAVTFEVEEEEAGKPRGQDKGIKSSTVTEKPSASLKDVESDTFKATQQPQKPQQLSQEGRPAALKKLPHDYTQEQLSRFMSWKIKNLMNKEYPDELEEVADAAKIIADIISYFYGKYWEKMGKRHVNLFDKTYTKVIYQFLNPPEAIVDEDAKLSLTDYQKMIDLFFKTEYGKRSGKTTDYHLPYFMSDKILTNLYYKIRG